jgi:LCP family protein required for cell wall assembly
MAKKSIDGLTRKDPKVAGKVAKRQKKTIAKQKDSVDLIPTKNSKVVKKAKKKVTSTTITARKKSSTTKSKSKAEKQAKDNLLIREYLDEIQDKDLSELSSFSSTENYRKRPKEGNIENEKKKKKKNKKKLIFTIIAILLLIGSILYMIADNFIRKTTSNGNLWNFVISSSTKPLKTDKNGRTNILVFGTEGYRMDESDHPGAQLTDSMMFLSLNQKTGNVKAVSLPRDLYYKTCGANKLNEVYNCKYEGNDGSVNSKEKYEKLAAGKLEDAVEETTGVDIQYYVHVNWAALIDMINAIGGIDVVFTYDGQEWEGSETVIETTSKKGLADWDNTKKQYSVNYKNGVPYHLDGVEALRVARVRNAYGGWGASAGNFSREVFQQKIIQAAVKKMRETNYATNWSAILGIKDAIGNNVLTDFEVSYL